MRLSARVARPKPAVMRAAWFDPAVYPSEAAAPGTGESAALLTRAVEDAPVYRYKWERCRDMLKQPEVANDVVWRLILDVDGVIDGESLPEPIGWMALVRRLRNRVAHLDSLARHHEVGSEHDVTCLSIHGQSTDAFTYLADVCDRVHDLTEQVDSDSHLRWSARDVDRVEPRTSECRRDLIGRVSQA